MTRHIHHGPASAADREQSIAIVDFLRRRDTRPFAADPNVPLPDAAASLWSRALGAKSGGEPPAWEPFALGAPFDRPLTVLSAQVPGCPDLTLLALALPIEATRHLLAVVFAALRPCPAGAGRHNVVALQGERDLAQALLSSVVGGRVEHAHCRPTHGDGAACWRLDQADEQHAADDDADAGRVPPQRH